MSKQTDEAMLNATATVNRVRKPVTRTAPKVESEPKIEVPQDAFEDKSAEKNDATKFRNFVNATGLALTKDGKVYLLAEAWQYIMVLKGLNCRCTCTEQRFSNNKLIVSCECTLYNSEGKTVSSGMMQAGSDEDWLKDKDAFAVYGMAQTRAISRAVRNKYGYLARACGFQAVPWDEMPKGK